MSENVKFKSKLGVVAATVGSAVGLGNVWRFPNEVQENGGAAFLMVYIGCVVLLGIPAMLAEFSLGRGVGRNAVDAFKEHTPKSKWWMTGWLALLAAYMINCYYMVVAGWTIEYLWKSVDGSMYEGVTSAMSNAEMESVFSEQFATSVQSEWMPAIWIGIVLLLNIFILLKGVQKGIERMSNLMMPVLFVIMLVLCVVSLSLPNASAGVEFFLNPDFSKITPDVFANALGQAFFSLSLGTGVLLTYSSYFPKKDNMLTTSVSVSMCDFMVALLMGFIIFPAVTSFGLAGDSEGLQSTALVFVTLPEVFVQMPGTQLWSILFFLLLAIAAITSTISIAEVAILYLQDKFKLSRKKAVLLVLSPLFVLSPLCALSQGVLKHITLFGMTIFDFFDTVATNYMLPIVALLTCVYVGWVLPKKYFKDEITNNGSVAQKFYPVIFLLVKYLAPLLIFGILMCKVIGF